MNQEEFLEKFKEVLQTTDTLTPQTNLIDIDEWDSLAMISTVAFLDKDFGKNVSVSQIREINTVEELMQIVEIK